MQQMRNGNQTPQTNKGQQSYARGKVMHVDADVALENPRVVLSMFDRGGVPDLSVSGDKSDLVVVDPHDPTTTSKTRRANAIAEPTPNGYQPCDARSV
jgi:hypothetical protein